MTATIHPEAVQSLVDAQHGNPFELLGPHKADDNTLSIHAFRPDAKALRVKVAGQKKAIEMTKEHDAGFFVAELPATDDGLPAYQLEATHDDGTTSQFDDPYRFGSQFTDYELYLFNEGRFRNAYDKLGAHLAEVDGVKGVHFAVWAPNAYRVSVMGDFNNWDMRVHPMRFLVDAGIWEIFIPGVDEFALYKFHIRSRENAFQAEKMDPYAFSNELRPRTASVVVNLDDYTWGDDKWMQSRAQGDIMKQPMAIYEVHLGSWKRKNGYEWLTYRELADDLVSYVKKMGYTHIELMPVAEHPFDGSWGYQVTGYFAPTSRFGTPQDFMYFVDQCHQNNIGVIVDWVPAHFPKDGAALSYFDGTHLYEHADPRQGEHPDWGTYIFNYGRNEVRNFLIANALFWLKYYHIDGLRVDAVSSMVYLDFGRKAGEWIPNDHGGNENMDAVHFLQEFNHVVHEEVPGAFTIAEESTAWPMVSRPTYLGGLGFTFKWNMGWMHDTLEYMAKDPVYRRYHHNSLTFSIMYAFSENFVLSLSHDEVVHLKGSMIGKMAGDWWQKFANLRVLAGYQYTHPGKKLNFMGAEFGQWSEWSEGRSLDWHLLESFDTHQKLQQWIQDLNQFYQNEPALYEQDFSPDGFDWIEANDADNSIYSYIRYADNRDDFIVVAFNMTPIARNDYRIGVPEGGYYREVINSDAELYGGGNVGNAGGRWADQWAMHGFGHSMSIVVPPLGMVAFKLDRYKK